VTKTCQQYCDQARHRPHTASHAVWRTSQAYTQISDFRAELYFLFISLPPPTSSRRRRSVYWLSMRAIERPYAGPDLLLAGPLFRKNVGAPIICIPPDCLHPTRTVVIIDILLRTRAAMHTTIGLALEMNPADFTNWPPGNIGHYDSLW